MDKEIWGEQPENVLDEVLGENADNENEPEKNIENDNKPENEEAKTGDGQQQPSREPSPEEEKEIERRIQNRHKRRMESKIQSLREENIALNERLKARVENQRSGVSEDAERIFEQIYGNEDEGSRRASALLKQYIDGKIEKHKQELQAAQEERELRASQAVAEEEGVIEAMMDDVEDAYPDADFSDRDTRRGFISALEKLSPKDENGSVTEYADPMGAWEFYQSQKVKSQSRAKEYASRGMAKSGGATANEAQIQQKEVEKKLLEAGLI